MLSSPRLARVLALLAALLLAFPAADAALASSAQPKSHKHSKEATKKKAHKRKRKRKSKGHKPAAIVPPLVVPLADGLRAAQATFWKGATVASGTVPDASMCKVSGPCFTYPLQLHEAGARLRVAIDTPWRSNTFIVQVLDATGKVRGSASNSNAFNAETFVDKPTAGAWTVRVLPDGVTNASFRLRAKLEGTLPARPTGHVALLPDLKAVPPYEFSFIAPANFANGLYPPDTANPPLDVAGEHPLSCTPDELAPVTIQGGAAHKCLRFTSGPINVGTGPFEMHFKYVDDIVNGKLASPIAHGPITQTIRYADGKAETRPAGTYSFHVIHTHFHDDHILDYQLFAVNDDSTLTKVGAGTKSGFCPANQLMGDWRSFDQASPDAIIGSGDAGAGNCQDPANGVLGLSPGWGDVYRWQRPGQYVEFSSLGDGLYVVRTTVDIEDAVREADEANNSAYALVRVSGDSVRLLERGQGLSPFDPAHVVFTGAGPASRD
jgi:hypothetical protein